MLRATNRGSTPTHRVLLHLVALAWLTCWIATVPARSQSPADPQRVTGANYKQAYKYSNEFLRQFVYSTSVTPNWIGKTDAFWYEYRTSKGKQWYRVNPSAATKEPLFDRVKLAAQLSEQVKKPLDALQLPLTRVTLSDDSAKLKFVTDQYEFEFDLRAGTLAKLGKAAAQPAGISPEQQELMRQKLGEERFREFMEKQKEQGDKKEEKKEDGAYAEESFSDDELRLIDEILGDDPQQKKEGKFGGKFGGGPTDRAPSPDKKFFAYAMNHNLYVAEVGKEKEALQLSKDSAGEDYTFNAGLGGGLGFLGIRDQKDLEKDKDKKLRPQVTWSKDSQAFYATRNDARGVKELYLVNVLATPRPTLSKYKYPMPGEENIRKSELHVYHKAKNQLIRIEPKWKDEAYSDLHFGKNSDELRFVRRDRLHRNAEFCTVNTRTGEAKCLILEGFENSSLVTQPVKYLEESEEMIWWSERSGWGHYYLYDRAGKLKNPITFGDFRASTIVAVDPKHRILYFRANAREPGECVYFNHLYSAHLDGSGVTLLDPGNANHDSHLSPSRQVVVDNCSRFDQAPVSVVRDARGQKLMDLEATDMSKLHEVGWKMPESFQVKAADGITDLCGHMWKPFDFDPNKKYPIIAHVYPGPQTESMQHAFTPAAQQQQLAQLGFIVIQVGNRGGTPLRSKAYQSYSYWNMRDYGLADKKFAIEQLAAKYPWVDSDRVGIYGHSGGGFMSAAALLVPPYNDFFKVAVASAGNHDNNVYNNSWAERYHGMKEVAGKKEEVKKDETATPPKKKGFKGKTPPDLDDDDPQGKVVKKDDKTTRIDEMKKDDKTAKVEEKKDDKTKAEMHFEIKVPTNAELAANLKGHLLLVHGDMDNNVHPAGTIRLADALIKANKRFDLLIMPGKAHGFGEYQAYFTQRMWQYFAEHLLDDRPSGADLYERRDRR
jgi:dipeptidyl aminopeptidase/acylaminoacyl peptidase